MAAKGGAAYRPYQVVMVGALPPFVGHVVEWTSHHRLHLAVREANRWRDTVAMLGCVPDWPYSFGVVDVRNGETLHMTDTTERDGDAVAESTRIGARQARFRREGRPG